MEDLETQPCRYSNRRREKLLSSLSEDSEAGRRVANTARAGWKDSEKQLKFQKRGNNRTYKKKWGLEEEGSRSIAPPRNWQG